MNLPTTRCDESGLCQLADESQDLVGPDRRYMRSRTSAVFVDISPVSVGHSLVIPAAHVTSTSALPFGEFLDAWTLAEQARHRVASINLSQPVMLLEHGLSLGYTGPACVRHVHIHVCPIDSRTHSWRVLEKTLANFLVSVRLATSLQEAMESARLMDSYVVGSLGPWWFTGFPRPKIRQVTRAILGSLATIPPADPDWILYAKGKEFRITMDILVGSERKIAHPGTDHTTNSSNMITCERDLG